MARPCKCCNHPNRRSIDADLHDKIPLPELAKRYGVTSQSLWRHSKHMDAKIEPVIDIVREVVQANPTGPYPLEPIQNFVDVNQKLLSLLMTLEEGLQKAVKSENLSAHASIGRECRASLELIARLYGMLNGDGTSVNVTRQQEEMDRFKKIVMETMCPECRNKVKERLIELTGT